MKIIAQKFVEFIYVDLNPEKISHQELTNWYYDISIFLYYGFVSSLLDKQNLKEIFTEHLKDREKYKDDYNNIIFEKHYDAINFLWPLNRQSLKKLQKLQNEIKETFNNNIKVLLEFTKKYEDFKRKNLNWGMLNADELNKKDYNALLLLQFLHLRASQEIDFKFNTSLHLENSEYSKKRFSTEDIDNHELEKLALNPEKYKFISSINIYNKVDNNKKINIHDNSEIDDYCDKYHDNILKLASFVFLTSLHKLPFNAFKNCPGCKKWFIHLSKKKRIYCNNKCSARDGMREKRKQKKIRIKDAERARKTYEKGIEKKFGGKIKLERRPYKYKKEN